MKFKCQILGSQMHCTPNQIIGGSWLPSPLSHPHALAGQTKSVIEDCQPTLCCCAFWIVVICWATTDKTSMSMRLNSSKHAHAPAL